MPTDIVVPEGNEKEIIAMAIKLGYTELIMAYRKPKKVQDKRIRLRTASIVPANSIGSTKKYADYVIYKATGDDRKAIESKPHIIFGLEDVHHKDGMHARSSALNQVMCAIMKKNKTMVALSFNQILKARPKRRAEIMGRMAQNIMLCRKYKVKVIIASFATDPYEMRSPHDLMALGRMLGMDTKQVKDCETLLG